MTKALRDGKVLVDWSQNSAAKTTVSVYCLRARERPTVSTPVTWDEVEACADAVTTSSSPATTCSPGSSGTATCSPRCWHALAVVTRGAGAARGGGCRLRDSAAARGRAPSLPEPCRPTPDEETT